MNEEDINQHFFSLWLRFIQELKVIKQIYIKEILKEYFQLLKEYSILNIEELEVQNLENYELNMPNWSWITSWQKTDCFLGKVLEEAREENMKFNKDFSKDLEIKMSWNKNDYEYCRRSN